ncbi:MAG: hypothetical protein B7Y95_05010 [Rhizobiales bacterium 32-66-11]|nr:MAG: hypothetical protein B7Y95_05010 [Rhizobiales bacterium 32-66-11]
MKDMTMLRVLGCVGLLLCAAPAMAAPVSFAVDPSATRIGFEVGAKGYPVTKGVFRTFSADLNIDFDMPARSKVMFRVGSNSLDTEAPALDDYVRGPGFLDSARVVAIGVPSSISPSARKMPVSRSAKPAPLPVRPPPMRRPHRDERAFGIGAGAVEPAAAMAALGHGRAADGSARARAGHRLWHVRSRADLRPVPMA